MKKIIIITGGSGGHVIPALSIHDHLKESFKVEIVTDNRGTKFINKNNYRFSLIDVPNLFANLYILPLNFIKFLISIINSLFYLKKRNIQILISTGGYMSIPFCIASYFLGVKIMLFEPNSVLGRANKFMLKFSKKIICYDKNIKLLPEKYRKKILLIDPILRKEVYLIKKNTNKNLSLKKKLLIIGGSQGAKFFDNNIVKLISKLSKNINIELFQQVFDDNQKKIIKKKYDELEITNKLFSFEENLFKEFSNFDLVITRSGASVISELSYFNVPFIAIPFPYAKDNHQYHNAKYYADNNGCWIINQNEYDLYKFNEFIINLFNKKIDYFEKKNNLSKITNQNTWNNVNKKLVELINEN